MGTRELDVHELSRVAYLILARCGLTRGRESEGKRV